MTLQPKPDPQLLYAYLSILSIDPQNNRKLFMNTIKSHYGLADSHRIPISAESFGLKPSPQVWTILINFCTRIKYPSLALSWIEGLKEEFDYSTMDAGLQNAL